MIQSSHSSSTQANKMEIENMHPFCLPFSLCHDATSSSFMDEAGASEPPPIGAEDSKSAQDDFDIFDLEIRIEDELDEFKLHFEDNDGHNDHHHHNSKKDDWFHMSDDFLLLSPPTPISTDIKSSPTLAQLNLNSNEDPTDGLWDSTTTTPTSATTLGRAAPRSSATTTSTLISPSVQRHRSVQNQHHHLSTLSPVSSDLLISTPSHLGFYQRPHAAAAAAAHQNHFHQDQFNVNRPLLQRCQSPAPLVTSSCSPLSTSGNDSNNKLKENIDYLTVLLCNGSKKLDSKSASPSSHQITTPQQSGISSSMAKSYSALTQSLATGPKLLERYQLETQMGEPRNQKPGQQQQQPFLHHENNFERVDSSVSAADSTGENHQVAPQAGANQAYNFCYSKASNQQQIDSRANEMKVLSSLLSSGKTVAGQIYPTPPEPMRNPTALINQPANCPSWPPNATTFNHAIGHQLPIRPLEGNLYQPDLGASCLNTQQQVYNQQVSSSIPINGRPITLTPLVSNNVNIPSRPSPLVSVPAPTVAVTAAAAAAAATVAAKSRAGPTFIQPASPSTSSTTSSSGNTETSSQSSPANKRQKPNQGLPSAANKTAVSDRSGRPSSMSTDGSLSSHDEGFSSQVDQDDCVDSMRDSEDDDGSDIDSDDESFYGDYTNNDLIGASISDNPECKWTLNMGRTRRNGQRRFFWQYNVQSKGPKGARVCSAESGENPFVLPEASDPVFSDECQIEGVKHSGKARRGDGNDLTPNPRKLLMIGLELKKLSKIINELAPVTDLPISARNKTRKEKNKLASRACRLKKKAQHEANKIKLYGLQREHQQVVMAIFDARKMIHKSLAAAEASAADQRLSSNLRGLLDQCIMTVAGQTGDYVNSVLEKVVSGCIDGGLQT